MSAFNVVCDFCQAKLGCVDYCLEVELMTFTCVDCLQEKEDFNK